MTSIDDSMKRLISNPYSYFFFRLSNTLPPDGSVIHSHMTGLMLLHHFTTLFVISIVLNRPLVIMLYEISPIVDVGIDQINLFLVAGFEMGFYQVWYRLNGKIEGIRKKFENESEQEKRRGTIFNIMFVILTIVSFCFTLILFFGVFLHWNKKTTANIYYQNRAWRQVRKFSWFCQVRHRAKARRN